MDDRKLVSRQHDVWHYQATVRELLASYQQLAHPPKGRRARGQVEFVAIPPDSGRTGVLGGLAKELQQMTPRPTVVGGSFASGQYVAWPVLPRPTVAVDKVTAVVAKVLEVAGPALGAAFGTPYLASATNFLKQLVETSEAVWELANQHASQGQALPLDPDGLKDLLRVAATQRPVVCLLEAADLVEARSLWWSQFLRPFAAEARDLRVLLVVTMTSPPAPARPVADLAPTAMPAATSAVLGSHQRDEPQPLYVARRLVEQGLATWQPLAPLSVAEVATWLAPCTPALVAQLHAATGGDPRWLAELWADWTSRHVVRQANDGTWQLTGSGSPAGLGRVNDLLGARLRHLLVRAAADPTAGDATRALFGVDGVAAVEPTLALLATAALEGPRFTAQALARTLDHDPDVLIDFLDAVLVQDEDWPEGLLVDAGFVQLEDPDGATVSLNRYDFAATLNWRTLRRYGLGPSERAERSSTYAWALVAVYAAQPVQIAAVAAGLLEAAGQRSAALKFQRQADFTAPLAVLRRQAHAVLGAKAQWEAWDEWECIQATALLLRAGKEMHQVCPFGETLTVYEGALTLATRAGLRHERLAALMGCGHMQADLEAFSQAARLLDMARTLAQQLGDRKQLADAAYELGRVQYVQDDLRAARSLFEEARNNYRHLHRRSDEAWMWMMLGKVDREEGDWAAAQEKLDRALAIHRSLGHLSGVSADLSELARIHHSRGDMAAAEDEAREALHIELELGDEVNATVIWELLGEIARDRGALDVAEDCFTHALDLAAALAAAGREVDTLLELSMVRQRRQDHAGARDALVRALRRAQQLDDQERESRVWRQLSKLALALGRSEASVPTCWPPNAGAKPSTWRPDGRSP